MSKTKKTFNFNIGADPEFVLTMQGKKVSAKQTMNLILNDKKEFHQTETGYEIGKYGNIGWDGSDSTAEIRPSPANSPQEVTNNIAKILKETAKYIQVCDLSTISEFSAVGGHIHFEIPKNKKWSTEQTNKIQRILSSFYLPILISENKTNLSLRLKQGYGSIKDYRIEPRFKYEDGTQGYTIEFRAPSAEWLTTPQTTTATLSYLAVIYHEALNNPKNFEKFNDLIFKSDKQGAALQVLTIMEFSLLTKTILNKAKKYIKTFEMYKHYKNEIEYLFNPLKVIKDKQKANYNIMEGWNLKQKTIFPKKSEILSSKKKIQDIAEKTDFDILKKMMNIHYNDDTNVALFVESFKDRVAAFNWKLKNNYYIFGIRKEIPEIIAKNLKGDFLTGSQLIKTKLDLQQTNYLFDRINEKFKNIYNNQNRTIDFITGKPKDSRESTITIGIPYEMRIKENLKPFLSFLWSLEKGQTSIKTQTQLKNEVIDDQNKELKNQGLLYKILTKQQETTPQVIIDNNSHSLRSNEQAMNQEIYEQNNTN